MAQSPGMFLFVDDNCSMKEMKQIVRKLKRKLNNFHVTDSYAEDADTEEIPMKRIRRNGQDPFAEKRGEGASCHTKDDDILNQATGVQNIKLLPTERENTKDSKTDRKLTSRLSRILKKTKKKKKSEVENNQRNIIESYDTDSTSSVDSGIQCEGCIEERTFNMRRDKSNIVAMDCEFVGVGPEGRNALGKSFLCSTVCALFNKSKLRSLPLEHRFRESSLCHLFKTMDDVAVVNIS